MRSNPRKPSLALPAMWPWLSGPTGQCCGLTRRSGCSTFERPSIGSMAAGSPTGAEVPKRLAPTKQTVRHLFAHSGNACAYPGCPQPLIDLGGNFVAELCHIEAAEPGGERFNAGMTNEERRHRDNLLILCHRHHVETNDVRAWPADRMQELKAEHEKRFEESVARITASAITDITKGVPHGKPETLARFSDFLGFDSIQEERDETRTRFILPLLESLALLAPDTRGVLLIVLERGESHDDGVGLPIHELEQATGEDQRVLWPHLDTLDRYRITYLDDDWEGRRWVVTRDLDGWPFWPDLKRYCSETSINLAAFVEELRFDLLD